MKQSHSKLPKNEPENMKNPFLNYDNILIFDHSKNPIFFIKKIDWRSRTLANSLTPYVQ